MKERNKMNYVGVKFNGKGKIYHYYTNLNHFLGANYDIVADEIDIARQ